MKHFHCPVNAWDCPYYKAEDCRCILDDPMADCDDFGWAWEGCDPEEYTDYDEE